MADRRKDQRLARLVRALESAKADGFTLETLIKTVELRATDPAARARLIDDVYLDLCFEREVERERNAIR